MRHFKLLLIAMSGVRVQNQALLEIGLTLPGFVERSEVIASLPSLGLLTLAAHTPPHWEVEYLEIDALTLAEPQRILAGGYDLVAVSSQTARVNDAYQLADALRSEGMTVVIGGLHSSVLPQEAALHADVVVQGEGEMLWPRLLGDFERGELQTFYSSFDRGHPSYRFTQAQVPRYDLLDISRYNRLTLQTTRGCPLDCEFCGASRLISPYKFKPLEQVRHELEAILRIWPNPSLNWPTIIPSSTKSGPTLWPSSLRSMTFPGLRKPISPSRMTRHCSNFWLRLTARNC